MRSSLACVEVGGSSTQTVVFGPDPMVVLDGAHQPPGARLALAVPGLLEGNRVLSASNLGWEDVDPVDELGLRGPAEMVCNDAEAAAVGEAALRDGPQSDTLVFVGLGTGIGGAVVAGGAIVASNLFGHGNGIDGDRPCRCGRRGCLETVAAGWALPETLSAGDLDRVARGVAVAVEAERRAAGIDLVVVAGGLSRYYPQILESMSHALPGRTVEPSAAPPVAKSAAPWGLRHLVDGREDLVREGGPQ